MVNKDIRYMNLSGYRITVGFKFLTAEWFKKILKGHEFPHGLRYEHFVAPMLEVSH